MNRGHAGTTHPARTLRERACWNEIGATALPSPARMGATQRLVTKEALTEASGERPLCRAVPSRFVIGEDDPNIRAALPRFMSQRAGPRRAIEIPDASHAVAVSRPKATAPLIVEATTVAVAA